MVNFLDKVGCYEKYYYFGKVIYSNNESEENGCFVNVLKKLK